MEDLDLTERTPFDTGPVGAVTIPLPKLAIEPLANVRPEGTRTRIARALPPPIPGRQTSLLPVARPSVPPPIPRLARASIPPPIPAARGSAVLPVEREEPSIHARIPERPQQPEPIADQPANQSEPAAEAESFAWNGSAIAEETYQAPRASRLPTRYIVGAGIAGAATFALVAFAVTRSSDPPAPAAALATTIATPAPAAPAPAPKEIVKPVDQPTTKPEPVAKPSEPGSEISIHSWPEGATVTLVDEGEARVIGKTPLVANIDPARAYDVVIAARDRPTAMRHLEAGDRELLVDLDPEPITLPDSKPVVTKPVSRPAIAKPAKVVKPRAEPKQVAAAPKATPKQVAVATGAAKPSAALANTGTLDVSTKPPCEILIDGQSTRLTTPQRGIALTPGAHSVTFRNPTAKIQKSVVIRIEKGRATKLIQDLMH